MSAPTGGRYIAFAHFRMSRSACECDIDREGESVEEGKRTRMARPPRNEDQKQKEKQEREEGKKQIRGCRTRDTELNSSRNG